MGWIESNEWDLEVAIAGLIEAGLIKAGSDELEVARQAIRLGVDSLDHEKKSVWHQRIVPMLNTRLEDQHCPSQNEP
jgi:hypothetical protein